MVGTLIWREHLTDRAGFTLPTLMDDTAFKSVELVAPKQVESKASMLKRGRN